MNHDKQQQQPLATHTLKNKNIKIEKNTCDNVKQMRDCPCNENLNY
jgi:hypothetical protein